MYKIKTRRDSRLPYDYRSKDSKVSTRRIIIGDGDPVDYAAFRKSPAEKLILKILKLQEKRRRT